MADTQEVQIKITADTSGADKSVGSIKKQLREATADLLRMREQFGETSDEAVAAAKKVANLRDEIGDAKALTDAFNPDAKFKAFGAALQGVAGGFAAVQGAQALFGSESEELEKTLVKVQGALALSQGLNSVLEAKDAFKNLGAVMKTIPIFQRAITAAQFLWNAATAANPIGALVTAIVALIAAGALLIKFFIDSSKEAKKNEEAVKANKKALDEQTKTLERNAQALETNQKYKLDLAKANGESTKAIRQLELKLIDEKIAFANASRETARNTFEKNKNALATLKANGASDETIKKQQEVTNESLKEFGKQTKNLNDANEQKNDIIRKQNIEIVTEQKKAADDAAKVTEENNKKSAEKAKENAEKKKQLVKDANEQIRQLEQQNYLNGIADEDKRAKEKLRIDKENEVRAIQAKGFNKEQEGLLLQQIDLKYQLEANKLEEEKLKKTIEDEKKRQEIILAQDKITNDLITQQRLNALTNEFDKKQLQLSIQQQEEIDQQIDFLNKGEINRDEYNKRIALIDEKYRLQREQLSLDENQKELNNQLSLLAARANNNQLAIDQRREALAQEQLLIDEAFKNNVLSEEQYNAKAKELSDARIQLDNAEAKAREDNLAKISGLLGNLADLVGKQTGVGKAFAIAQATIDTYLSATKAYQSLSGIPVVGPALGAVAAGAAIASGIKNVKSILAVKVPGGAGGGGAPSGGSVPNAPSVQAPIQPQLASTLINQGQVNQIGSAAARAYVVESDVSGNQERIQRINRAARIS
jgi:hypothetical protein